MAKSQEEQLTEIWKEYQKGKEYLASKGYYEQLERNYKFFMGDQWDEQAKKLDMPMPVDNIIEPICKYKIGVVAQNNMNIIYTSDNIDDGDIAPLEDGTTFKEIADKKMKLLNVLASQFIENNNLETEIWDYDEDNCIDGMVCMYIYKKDDKEIAEMVNANNIFFSDENEKDIQNQEYILITFRRSVEQVRKEAKENRINEEIISRICKDSDIEEQIGNKTEVETENGKVLCILKLYKKNGTVHMMKSTKNAIYVNETDLKITLYPIAKNIWRRERNNARGRGEPQDKINNQIEINKTEARRALAITLTSYPKLVYLKELISNPGALNKVGVGIGIEGGLGVDIRSAIDYLRPVQISPDAKQFSDELRQNTKDNASASDSALGNINPEKAAGRAIIAVKDASVVPISTHVARKKNFYEDIARILFDFWQNTSPNGRRVVIEEKDQEGQNTTTIEEIPEEMLKRLKTNKKVEIVPTDSYSTYAQEQSWENLFTSGYITFEEYVSGLPDNSRSNKAKLQKILDKRQENQEKIMRIEEKIKEEQMLTNKILNNQEMSKSKNNDLQLIEQQSLGGDTNEM